MESWPKNIRLYSSSKKKNRISLQYQKPILKKKLNLKSWDMNESGKTLNAQPEEAEEWDL